jgi:PAS domain S-box-containing protein
MNPLSLIHFFASAIYIYLGIYSIKLEPRSSLNRTFFYICVSFALWAFAFAFMHASTSISEIRFWYNVSSPGWCMFSGAAVHFLLILSKSERVLKKKWIYIFLYGPGLMLIYKQWADSFAAIDFVRVGYGLTEIPRIDSPWYWFFMFYQSGYILAGLLPLYLWGIRTTIRREKRQAAVMFVSTAVVLAIAFTNDILLPALKIYVTPSLSPVIVLTWALGMWFSITRYKLMSLNLANASNEIISSMKDMLVLVDTKGRMVKINQRIASILGYDEKDMLNRSIGILVRNGGELEKNFLSMMAGTNTTYEIIEEFVTSDGDIIPVEITITALRDRFEDPIGAVVVGSDIRETLQLWGEIRARAKTESELRQRNETIEADLVNAQIIQKALLPTSAPALERLAVDFRNYSMSEVGGDYFSFVPIGQGDLGVFIGDVAGHGVSAALFLSLLKSASEWASRKYGRQPMDFIRDLNGELLANMPHYFITAIYGYFSFPEPDGGAVFTFSNGGHPEPVICRAGSGDVFYQECEGTLLGKFKTIRLNEVSINLNKGDRIFLYTDGLPETRDGDYRIFGFPNLVSLIRKSNGAALSETLDAVMRGINEYRGDDRPEDDIVIIGFEVR